MHAEIDVVHKTFKLFLQLLVWGRLSPGVKPPEMRVRKRGSTGDAISR
jgi:hypothetical protein